MPRWATIFEFVIGLRSETGTQYHLSHLFCNLATTGSTGQQQQLLSCKYHGRACPILSSYFALPAQSSLSFFQRRGDFDGFDLTQHIVIREKYSPNEDCFFGITTTVYASS